MTTTTQPATSPSSRWYQLILGLIAMMAISSPQYVWALFTGPLREKFNAPLAEIQVTFSLLIMLQTFLSPAQGYLVDRFGPRVLLSFLPHSACAVPTRTCRTSRPMRQHTG